MSLLDLLNAETKPAPIEVKPEPDPKTIELVWIPVPIEPIALELGNGEAEERAAELAAAEDAEKGAEILRRHHATDLLYVSVAWRLMNASAPVVGNRQRYRMRCPACQADGIEPAEWSLIFDGEYERGGWDGSPRAEPRPDRFRAACLRGCSPDVIGPAVAALIREDEAAERAEEAERVEREAAAKREALLVALRPKPKPAAMTSWIIDGWLRASTVTTLIGHPFGGKSFVGFSEAIAIAAGLPWAGRATRRGRVLLVLLGEGTTDDDHLRRLRCIADGMGADFDRLVEEGWIMIYPNDLKLDVPASVDQLRTMIDDLEREGLKPALLVLDNLIAARANRTIGAGNDPGVVRGQLDIFVELASRGITSRILHHANAAGESHGSNQVPAVMDTEVRLDRASAAPDAWITCSTRARGGAPPPFRLRFVGGLDRDGEPDGSPIVLETDEARRPAAATEPKPDPHAENRSRLLELCAPPGLTATEIYEQMGGRRGDVTKLRNTLVDEGLLTLEGGRYGRI